MQKQKQNIFMGSTTLKYKSREGTDSIFLVLIGVRPRRARRGWVVGGTWHVTHGKELIGPTIGLTSADIYW